MAAGRPFSQRVPSLVRRFGWWLYGRVEELPGSSRTAGCMLNQPEAHFSPNGFIPEALTAPNRQQAAETAAKKARLVRSTLGACWRRYSV